MLEFLNFRIIVFLTIIYMIVVSYDCVTLQIPNFLFFVHHSYLMVMFWHLLYFKTVILFYHFVVSYVLFILMNFLFTRNALTLLNGINFLNHQYPLILALVHNIVHTFLELNLTVPLILYICYSFFSQQLKFIETASIYSF
jgi:hypothetical protein